LIRTLEGKRCQEDVGGRRTDVEDAVVEVKEKARLAGSAVDGGDPTFGGTRVGIRAAMKMAVDVSDRWKRMAWPGLAMWCRRNDDNLRIVVETLH
jgi:hypothetical protein